MSREVASAGGAVLVSAVVGNLRRVSVLALILTLFGVILVLAGVASAHPRGNPVASAASSEPVAITASLTETLSALPKGPDTPWILLAATALLALAVGWRPRRVVALALVATLAILAFEVGLHSTHHLAQPEDAARCAVAAASAKLSIDLGDPSLDIPCAPAVVTPVVAPALPIAVTRIIAPDAGRAPPALSA